MIYYLTFFLLILVIKGFLLKKGSANAVDQWYWFKYRDAVKSQKTCPPELPEYILEVKQWYPPIFGWFLSKIPDGLFKYSNLLTQILSLFRLLLILSLAYSLNLEFSFALYLAIIVYLTAPILVYYDNQINSRIFGAILVDVLILLFYGYFEYHMQLLVIPIFTFTTLLIFTHKMSHQLYIFLIVAMSIFFTNPMPIVIYIAATLVAIRFFNYKSYLRHHLEIVKFWHRNRYNLGAHQFYESKIYGKEDFVYINRLHGNGIKSFVKKLSLIVGMFPFIIFILFNFEFNFFSFIISMTILFIFLTSFVDRFLCLGSGNLYTYNLVTFSSFYVAYTPLKYDTLLNLLLLFIVSLMTIFSIYRFYQGLNKKFKNKRFDSVIEFISESSLDRIIVIPFQLPDEVAYKTGKKLFWGGHGYGFLWLEPYFPVMNCKIEEAILDWNLGAVLLKKDYFIEFFEKIDTALFDTAFENEDYILLAVKNWKNSDKIPKWAIEKYPDIFGSHDV